MVRSIWKKPYCGLNIFKSLYFNDLQKHIFLKFKNFVIFPSFSNIVFSIYNGKRFITIQVADNMIGYKFGEFITTRKKTYHKKIKTNDQKKKYK
jgi:small subunit ribosomal protein S19